MGDLLDLNLYMEAIMRIQYSDPYYTTKPEATFFWSIRPWDKTGFIILKSSNLRPVRSRSDAPKSRLSGWLLPHHSCIVCHFECRSRVIKSHLFCISFLLFFCRSIICLWLNIHSVLYMNENGIFYSKRKRYCQEGDLISCPQMRTRIPMTHSVSGIKLFRFESGALDHSAILTVISVLYKHFINCVSFYLSTFWWYISYTVYSKYNTHYNSEQL